MELSQPAKKKKRVEEDYYTSSVMDREDALVVAGGASTVRSSFEAIVLEQQLSQVQAELEHERSMRQLDQKRSKQTIDRLERQAELSEIQAREAVTTLEEYRETSESRIKQLREAQNESLQKLRITEIKLLQKVEDEEENATEKESTMVKFYEEKCVKLRSLQQQQEANEEELRREIEKLQQDIKNMQALTVDPAPPSARVQKLLEEAPSDILKELHRIRMCLSDSQRKERLAQRQVIDLEERNHRLIRECEELRIASERLPIVQQQLDEVHGTYAKMEAEHNAWQEFGNALRKLLKLSPSKSRNPPDLAVVENALSDSRSRASNIASQSHVLKEERQRLQTRLESKDSEIKELQGNLSEITREKSSLEKQLEQSQSQSEKSKAQMEVYKRETDNLRELIKTFDNLPLASAAESRAGDILKSPRLDTSKRTLQITLNSTREELRLAQTEIQRIERESEASTSELTRVKEKFEKLKEALQAERAKTAASEQRANEAEALAGKGSFDPEKTRVMHFTETPLVEALKEEVKVLQRQLEVAKGPKSSSKSAHHNPDKLNQRLKENFKEQIALFREGVYLATGFKVDMLPGADRPTFRFRSLYSANEKDHLMLKWPKTEDVSSLDILNTDFAKSLAETPSYQYMTKFHSLPAFLASVQLSLFENTTQAM